MAEKGSMNCTHVIFDLDGLMLGKNSNSFIQTCLKFYGHFREKLNLNLLLCVRDHGFPTGASCVIVPTKIVKLRKLVMSPEIILAVVMSPEIEV